MDGKNLRSGDVIIIPRESTEFAFDMNHYHIFRPGDTLTVMVRAQSKTNKNLFGSELQSGVILRFVKPGR